ncbi:MAG: diguanylate cyclase [Acidobacteriota bacterium]
MSSYSPKTSAASQAEAWKELALLTLEAVANHAVECGDENDSISFRSRVREMTEGLRADPDTAQILVAAGSVSQRFASYCAQVQESILALSQAVTRSETAPANPETAVTAPAAMEIAAQQLVSENSAAVIAATLVTSFVRHITDWGSDASSSAGLEALQIKLEGIVAGAGCGNAEVAVTTGVTDLLQDVEATLKRNHEMIVMLQNRVASLKTFPNQSVQTLPPPVNARPTDACTGLPLRADAESLFRQALENGSTAHLVVFYLHRMQLTNARFGSSVGDQVIFYCSQKIATDLITGANDQLFRWTGPAFVALVGHLESEADIRSEVQRLVSSPSSRYFETATRSVFLPVKLSAEVHSLRDATLDDLIQKLEIFILNSSGVAQG